MQTRLSPKTIEFLQKLALSPYTTHRYTYDAEGVPVEICIVGKNGSWTIFKAQTRAQFDVLWDQFFKLWAEFNIKAGHCDEDGPKQNLRLEALSRGWLKK